MKTKEASMESEQLTRQRLIELTTEILTDELGRTEVSLGSTVDEIDINSLAMVALVESLQERLNIRIELREAFHGDRTLGNLIDQLYQKINSSGEVQTKKSDNVDRTA
jgi:acyl carrier protein